MGYSVIPESGTENVIKMDERSNVGRAGVWIFEISREIIPVNQSKYKNTVNQFFAITILLNQARAWFLEIVFVKTSGMRVCVFVCLCVCVCVCPPPRLLKTTHVK